MADTTTKRPLDSPEDDDQAWKKQKFHFSETLSVVTSDSKHLVVHKDIITKRSPFFAAAQSETWNPTGVDNPISLANHDSDTVEAYLQCLYLDCIPALERLSTTVGRMIKVYLLADEIGDLWTANKTIDAILQCCKDNQGWPNGTHISYIYTSTPEHSPLRRLVVDYYVFRRKWHSWEGAQDLPPKFLIDCLNAYTKMTSNAQTRDRILDALRKGHPHYRPAGHYYQHDPSNHVFCCLQAHPRTKIDDTAASNKQIGIPHVERSASDRSD